MSASSPIPEGVRRDLERMAGPLAERMLPPKVTQSATTRNVVAAVNDDGTVDVMMGGAVMQRVPATTACAGVAVGDEVIVEQYGPRLYCVGVVAKSLDNAAYVKLTDFAPGFSAYAADQQPTLRVSGGVAVMSGACTNATDVTPGASGVQMLTVPAGYRPAQVVRAVCQGSGVYRYMLAVNPDGTVLAARYGDTTNREAPAGSWFVLDATWAIA